MLNTESAALVSQLILAANSTRDMNRDASPSASSKRMTFFFDDRFTAMRRATFVEAVGERFSISPRSRALMSVGALSATASATSSARYVYSVVWM